MGRSACCEKVGLKKGPWTPEEDQKLVSYIEQHGHGSWRALPSKAGLERCGKSCRLRWTNYLRPDIKRGKFSLQEERTIIQLHALLGNRWSVIAGHLAKRTDNEIKNYWNTHLKKRLTKMGIDPTTHKPKTDHHPLGSASSTHHAANLSHMAQWESARLEAEARLVRDSKYATSSSFSSSHSRTPPARLVLNRIPAARSPLPPCLDVLKAWQNSWSPSSSIKDKSSTRVVHNMYALMLAQNDDVLESPTSTLSFPPEPAMLPPLPPARGCLKDDDIMVAVEAFMGEKRYNNNNNNNNLAYSNSITTTSCGMEDHDVNIGDEFEDMLVYENSNQNLAIVSEEGGFMMSHNYNNCENDNIDSSWNNIYSELSESFAT